VVKEKRQESHDPIEKGEECDIAELVEIRGMAMLEALMRVSPLSRDSCRFTNTFDLEIPADL
jgi:hypothetical protein